MENEDFGEWMPSSSEVALYLYINLQALEAPCRGQRQETRPNLHQLSRGCSIHLIVDSEGNIYWIKTPSADYASSIQPAKVLILLGATLNPTFRWRLCRTFPQIGRLRPILWSTIAHSSLFAASASYVVYGAISTPQSSATFLPSNATFHGLSDTIQAKRLIAIWALRPHLSRAARRPCATDLHPRCIIIGSEIDSLVRSRKANGARRIRNDPGRPITDPGTTYLVRNSSMVDREVQCMWMREQERPVELLIADYEEAKDSNIIDLRHELPSNK